MKWNKWMQAQPLDASELGWMELLKLENENGAESLAGGMLPTLSFALAEKLRSDLLRFLNLMILEWKSYASLEALIIWNWPWIWFQDFSRTLLNFWTFNSSNDQKHDRAPHHPTLLHSTCLPFAFSPWWCQSETTLTDFYPIFSLKKCFNWESVWCWSLVEVHAFLRTKFCHQLQRKSRRSVWKSFELPSFVIHLRKFCD